MEPIASPATPTDTGAHFPKRPFKIATRGASSHFVGSAIVILSSYAVTTLAMNCAKHLNQKKHKADSD